MAGGAVLIGLAGVVVAALTLAQSVHSRGQDATGCRKCHIGFSSMGPYHRFPCERCHNGDPAAKTKPAAHKGLLRRPAGLNVAPQKCGQCHPAQVRSVPRSLMATAVGIIAPTRFLWGAQPDLNPIYATKAVDGLKTLPLGKKHLVDDLLRRRCLRCHLHTTGAKRRGDFRGLGCAACHVTYGDDGRYRGPDKVLKNMPGPGLPRRHRFTTAIPTRTCLHCHNGPRIGADYVGLFPRDFHAAYRFLKPGSPGSNKLHGQDYRRLTSDVHHVRGLHCIDCHPAEELMGHGRRHTRATDQVRVRCFDCHGLPGRPPRTMTIGPQHRTALRRAEINPKIGLKSGDRVVVTSGGHLLSHVKFFRGQYVLTSRVTGSRHVIPQIQASLSRIVNHRVPGHLTRMTCSACHAAWTAQDFGFHLFREDYANYLNWAATRDQDDPQVQSILRRNLARPKARWTPPRARDWLTGKSSPGIWYQGFSYRRWEGRILGVNRRHQMSCLRPQYQYVVTRVDKKRRVRLDSRIPRTAAGRRGWAMNPYTPHTIRRATVGCDACHGNPRALGLGNRRLLRYLTKNSGKIRLSGPLTFPAKDGLPGAPEYPRVVDLRGRPLQVTTRPRARFLSAAELGGLLRYSLDYQRFRLEELRGVEWLQWLRPRAVKTAPATRSPPKTGR
ncbi:MAG: cytochrome c family protein [Proteobacteria bacterium]|nr:cytochrome c family protein [Pseudomonadota bacterium]